MCFFCSSLAVIYLSACLLACLLIGYPATCGFVILIQFAYISTVELKEDISIVVLGASGDLARKKTVSLFDVWSSFASERSLTASTTTTSSPLSSTW